MRDSFSGSDKRSSKQEKFDFEKMKQSATHRDAAIRKKSFLEYFARFAEFPAYLFDTKPTVDPRLLETIRDVSNDPATSAEEQNGIKLLKERLSTE